MTPKLVIRESKLLRQAASSSLVLRMTDILIIIPYMNAYLCLCKKTHVHIRSHISTCPHAVVTTEWHAVFTGHDKQLVRVLTSARWTGLSPRVDVAQ